MLNKIAKEQLKNIKHGWLESNFHFSFAEYYNPDNMNFGVLRVLNDDYIQPSSGFPTHPHRDMEIITYVIKGELSHEDSMGNVRTLTSGQVQYMSAGTGITHSEYNASNKEVLELFQMWVIPDKTGYTPNYGDIKYDLADRKDKLLHFVSGVDGLADIKVNQDVNFYVTETEKPFNFEVNKNRQAYLAVIDGDVVINDIELNKRDALTSIEENLNIKPNKNSVILIIEMAKKNGI